MKTAIIATIALASAAHAETLFTLSDSMYLWNGGFAANIGNGWIGNGWDRFPGISPPWNPVGSLAAPAPQVIVVPMPQAPAPACGPGWGFQDLMTPPPQPAFPVTYDIIIGNTVISTPKTW